MNDLANLFTLKAMKCGVCGKEHKTFTNGLGISSNPVEVLMCLDCYARGLKWAAEQSLKVGGD